MSQATRREFLSAAAASAAACAGTDEAEAKRPNLVFVFPDQMRGSAMGFLGEEPVVTPRLDAFAREALALTQAASIYPVCSPYRAMLMTGKYPQASGVVSNCTNHSFAYGVELRQSDRCWSDVLADAGYSLGYIGKWHLEGPKEPYVESYNNEGKTAWNEWTPPERRHGFGFWHAYNTYDRHMAPWYWTTEMGRDDRLKVEQWGPEHEADTAIDFLENADGSYRDPEQPFALVVSMNPPHTPYHMYPDKYQTAMSEIADEELFARPNIPPEGTEFGDRYRKNIRNYLTMIHGVDEQFGRILDALEAQGLAEDTIVVFTSDHGDCLGINGQVTKNNHYEESMRVPFLVRWPGEIPARQDPLLFSNIDIYPTLLDLLGLGDQTPAEVQGESRARLFRSGQGDRPTSQPYLKMPFQAPEQGRRGVRTERYTLMIERLEGEPGRAVLFHRQEDPYQLSDVAGERPEIVDRLVEEELKPWLERMQDPWRV